MACPLLPLLEGGQGPLAVTKDLAEAAQGGKEADASGWQFEGCRVSGRAVTLAGVSHGGHSQEVTRCDAWSQLSFPFGATQDL